MYLSEAPLERCAVSLAERPGQTYWQLSFKDFLFGYEG